ncbi:MAG: hypothetical protein V4555_12795, partial [Acidobacteriota bacterium]
MGAYSISHNDLLVIAAVLVPLIAAAATAALLFIRSLRRQLALSQAQLHMVMENMEDRLIVINPDQSIAMMNHKTAQLVADSNEDVTYHTVVDQYEAFRSTGDPLPAEDWPTNRAFRGDFVKNFILIYRHKLTGNTGSRSITTAPVPPGAGKPGQVLVSYREDSERRHVDIARSRLAAIV